MTDLEFYGTGITLSLPERWSEMSPAQIRRIFRLNDWCIRKGSTMAEFRIRMLYFLLGVKLGRKTALLAMSPEGEQLIENVALLCERCLAGFFDSDEDGTLRLRFDDIRNSLPRIRRGLFRRPLVGPDDLLQNLSFGEFRHASRAMTAFFESGSITDLDECISILYRVPSRKGNRAGRAVAPQDPPRDLARVSRLPAWQKNLVMMWLAACLHYLQTGTVIIDGESVNMSLLFGSGERSGGSLESTWSDLLLQIAKDGVIGTVDRVDEEPLFSIFRIMWSNYKEAKRYEKTVQAHKA